MSKNSLYNRAANCLEYFTRWHCMRIALLRIPQAVHCLQDLELFICCVTFMVRSLSCWDGWNKLEVLSRSILCKSYYDYFCPYIFYVISLSFSRTMDYFGCENIIYYILLSPIHKIMLKAIDKNAPFFRRVILLCLYREHQTQKTQKTPHHRPQTPSTKNPNPKNPI